MKKSLVIFGPGCPRCRELSRRVEQAAQALQLDYELIKMTEIKSFASFGVSMTPALMVDDVVKVMGKVPSIAEIQEMLQVEKG